jgi:hypothetical protein
VNMGPTYPPIQSVQRAFAAGEVGYGVNLTSSAPVKSAQKFTPTVPCVSRATFVPQSDLTFVSIGRYSPDP